MLHVLALIAAFNPAAEGNVHDADAPHLFPLPDGRQLGWNWRERNGGCWLQEGAERTELGACAVLKFGSAGWFAVRDARMPDAHEAEILDVDPRSNSLRAVWAGATVERIVPIGGEPGVLWFFADQQLVRVREGEGATVFDVSPSFMPAGLMPIAEFPTGDSMRGGRLLAATFALSSMHDFVGVWPEREAELAIIDLDHAVTRPLGRVAAVIGVPLGETIYLPTLSLGWATDETVCREPRWRARYLVSEATERVFANPESR